jgi:hypothetical protein
MVLKMKQLVVIQLRYRLRVGPGPTESHELFEL